MNSTGMSFGGGFASGLAQVLGQRRQEKQAAQDRQIGNQFKMLQFMLDTGQISDAADLQPIFDGLNQLGAFGDPKAKGKKGQPGVQDHAANILGMVLNQKQGQPGAPVPDPNQAGLGPDDGGQTPPPQMLEQLAPRNLSFPTAVTPPRTLNGIPLLTQEQAMQRKIDNEGTAIMAKVNLARTKIFPALKAVDPTATMDDAFAAVGIRPSQASQFAPSFQEVSGKMPDGTRVTGVLDARRGMFVDPISKEPLAGFVKDEAGAGARMGTNREALALSKFGKRFSELTREEATQVMDAEQEYLAQTAQSRVEGAGTGAMNVPMTPDKAQDAGVPTGTTPNEIAGQIVPSKDDIDRAQQMKGLRGSIQRLLGDPKTGTAGLIDILPREKDLNGKAPGLTVALRRRQSDYRTRFSQLDSVLSTIVNTYARVAADQKGAQTEPDAQRAYQSLLEAQGSILDPLKGDTYESAVARLTEAMNTLDRIEAGIPKRPVPNKDAAPAVRPGSIQPAASHAPTGAKSGAGAPVPGWFITPDGKLVQKQG